MGSVSGIFPNFNSELDLKQPHEASWEAIALEVADLINKVNISFINGT